MRYDADCFGIVLCVLTQTEQSNKTECRNQLKINVRIKLNLPFCTKNNTPNRRKSVCIQV